MLSEKIPRATFLLCLSRRLKTTSTKFEKGSDENLKERNQVKFSKLVIWGGNANRYNTRERRTYQKTEYHVPSIPLPWTSIWPSAHSSSNILPIPIRQGHVKNQDENSGLVPDRFNNTELMKIPNFLHLTPAHIKKHCDALKPFLTTWPSGLQSSEVIQKHYPIEVVTREFVFSSPSMRDERARLVTLRLPVKRLHLDLRQLDKLRALAGPDRFETDENGVEMLVLKSERCPIRKQNYDFLCYVLTALTAESKKIHAWEEERTQDDWKIFRWEGSSSQKTVERLAKDLPGDANALKRYKKAVTKLGNSKEELERIEEYKDSVKQLLGLQKATS